ncbi:Extended synaptotagmin-3 [Halotydeus destructor]|nr:Extended synaptotagmin-3 [Halotydeus destructor]
MASPTNGEQFENEPDTRVRIKLSFSSPFLTARRILNLVLVPEIIGIVMAFLLGQALATVARWYINDHHWTLVLALLIVTIIPLVPVAMAIMASCRTYYKSVDYFSELHLREQDVDEVLKNLPWSWSEPDVDGGHFVNCLVGRMWPYIQAHINETLGKMVADENLLNDALGPLNRVLNIQFTRASISDLAPVLTGIRVLNEPTRKDQVAIDTEFTIDSNTDIQLAAKLKLIKKLINFSLGIEWLLIKVKSRLILSPLMAKVPLIGGLTLKFLEPIQLDWRLTGLVRPLNATLFKKLVRTILNTGLGTPSQIHIQLDKPDATRETNATDLAISDRVDDEVGRVKDT